MIDLNPINERVQNTEDAIAAQEAVLNSLEAETGRVKNEMANVSDPEMVDACYDKCEAQLEQIRRDQKKAQIKLGILNSTLANARQELLEAEEVNRLELRADYHNRLEAKTKKVNEASEVLKTEIKEYEALIQQAHRDTELLADKESRFYHNNEFGVPGLPKFIFEVDRSRVQLAFGSDFDYLVKKFQESGRDITT